MLSSAAIGRAIPSFARCCSTSTATCTTQSSSRRTRAKAAIEQIEKEKGDAPFLASSSTISSKELLERIPDEYNRLSPFYDSFGRLHNYLRISLTEKCNLRCVYCMPEKGVPVTPWNELLTTEEIFRLVRIFAENGIDKIRLTGGEPTIRDDLVEIVEGIKAVPGIESVGITSNGLKLWKNVRELREAGVTKMNISLDTLDREKYLRLARRTGLPQVMKSIRLSEELFDKVKINTVVLRGENYDEVLDFVRLTEDRNLDVRFIEFMPFGGDIFRKDSFVGYLEMLERIREVFGDDVIRMQDGPNDTTKAFKVKGFKGQFGFITSMSEHFCGTCNRLRITANGHLKVCLHGNEEVNLRELMREGVSDAELTGVIRDAVFKKKKQHADSSNKLSHVGSDGSAKQVDVSGKAVSHRVATAECYVKLTPEIVRQVKMNITKKGDVINVAKIAAIMGAKQTANLIPLCHNVPINVVETHFDLQENDCHLRIECTVKTDAATGIEMEALTACTIAALTVYDMCKAVSSEMIIENIRLLRKTGGRRDFSAK